MQMGTGGCIIAKHDIFIQNWAKSDYSVQHVVLCHSAKRFKLSTCKLLLMKYYAFM